MEGPERLVANWGAKGLMADLSDLWTDDQKADISASVEAACKDSSGAYYEFPLCMTAHCMAINKTVFEAAGAMQYVDAENHTWTTDNFLKAVQAVYDSGKTDVRRDLLQRPGRRPGHPRHHQQHVRRHLHRCSPHQVHR